MKTCHPTGERDRCVLVFATMNMRSWGALGALLLGAPGCATGTVDDFELASGVYELSTTDVAGDCVLDGAITAGDEFVGKLKRVIADASSSSVKLEACDDFFDDTCHPEPFIEPVTMLRDTSDLRAENAAWEVPGCVCFDDYRGERRVDGLIVENDRAELSWSFVIPAAPDGCTCSVDACTLEVQQALIKEPIEPR